MNSNTLRILSLIGKGVGLVLTIAAPFGTTAHGMIVFAAASILKDVVNRVGDMVDDGKPNDSFKP